MHIALFSPAWPPVAQPNGIVTYVREMREELIERGHHVSIVTPCLVGVAPDAYSMTTTRVRSVASRIRSRLFGVERTVFDSGKAIAATLLSLHRKRRIDIVEMEESFGWFRDVSRLGLPTVVKLHGPAFMSLVEEELKPLSAQTRIRREGEALRTQRVLTSPSSRTLTATVEHYGLRPQITRHIVNPLRLPAGSPIWDASRCDRRSLLFVGRFDKRKGADIVLRAFSLLLEAVPDLQLVFVGPDLGILNQCGQTIQFETMKASLFPGAMADRVVFRGKLRADEIYALRARAFATIVASRWENQSYTLVEAMLQGCPLVVTDVGGQGEAIQHGETGLLTEVGDPLDLAAKLHELLDDPARAARMGRAAREHAVREHSPGVVVGRTLALYEEALAHLAGSSMRR